MYVTLCHSVILAAAITAHKMGRPELTHSIKRLSRFEKGIFTCHIYFNIFM